jgi:hypothetical protein
LGAGYGGVDGGTNTGGGGGGGGNMSATPLAPFYVGSVYGGGGSGIVIISHPIAYANATNNSTSTRSVVGGNVLYTFTTSGNITF